MRSHHWLLVLAVLVLGFTVTEDIHAAKEKSDKQRIAQLELQVSTIQEDLAGEHQWAMSVNDALNTLNANMNQLNGRLVKLEHGPLARMTQ